MVVSFMSDSTPLAYDLEQRHPGARSIIPEDKAQAFLCHHQEFCR